MDCSLLTGSCDFENDLCSWSQVDDGSGDDFDWVSHKGKTTSGTEPTKDHTENSISGAAQFKLSALFMNEKSLLLTHNRSILTFILQGSQNPILRSGFFCKGLFERILNSVLIQHGFTNTTYRSRSRLLCLANILARLAHIMINLF